MLAGGQHILQAHARGGLRLMRVAQNGFGNHNLSHGRFILHNQLRRRQPNSAMQHARRNGGADDAGHVGAHRVHQQEVAGILLLAFLLGYARRHRHGGYAGRADERIDLAASGQQVHELGQQHAAGGAAAKGDTRPAATILMVLQVRKVLRRSRRADGSRPGRW